MPPFSAMAERTPLLPTSNRPPHSHPIFFQVCHSPWRFLPAKALLPIRMFIALYMTTILAFQLYLEIGPQRIGKFFAFEINNISLLLQVIYYWITSVSLTPSWSAHDSLLTSFLEVLDTATHLEAEWSVRYWLCGLYEGRFLNSNYQWHQI